MIAVVEEAQAVLGGRGSSGEGPYISWVKEGRKYDLGAILITQQPGSITGEILSQGDNWFVFHLLSAGDLAAIKSANAHFSNDLLSSLLNEPIPGHGVYWSSVGGKSYPVPLRVLSFEGQYQARDSRYNKPPAATAALRLRERFAKVLASNRPAQHATPDAAPPLPPAAPISAGHQQDAGAIAPEEAEDVLETYVQSAIRQFAADATLVGKIRGSGSPWMGVQKKLEDTLPEILSDRNKIAFDTVPRALDAVFGKGGWKTERRPSKSRDGAMTTWIVLA